MAKSDILRKAFRSAAVVARDPEMIANLIRDVTGKAGNIDESKKKVAGFLEKIRTFLRMLAAYIRGDYREIPWRSIVLIVGALIYFMIPLDLIPDFIPASGLLDDISVVLLVFNTIDEDIAAFLEYERSVKV